MQIDFRLLAEPVFFDFTKQNETTKQMRHMVDDGMQIDPTCIDWHENKIETHVRKKASRCWQIGNQKREREEGRIKKTVQNINKQTIMRKSTTLRFTRSKHFNQLSTKCALSNAAIYFFRFTH